MRFLLIAVLSLTVCGCASLEFKTNNSSDYIVSKEIPGQLDNAYKLNLCRVRFEAGGRTVLSLWIDSKEQMSISSPPLPGFKSRATLVSSKFEKHIELKTGPRLIAKIERKDPEDKEVYIIVDGKTKSWFVLPLLVVNITNFSGNFSVTSVDKKTYEDVCGTGTDVIFINPQ